jgi:hypothetical protein
MTLGRKNAHFVDNQLLDEVNEGHNILFIKQLLPIPPANSSTSGITIRS